MSSIDITKKEFITSLTDSITAKSPHGRIQPRDYEIMRFILEQKFSSLESIYFRFFDVRDSQTEPLPKNLWTTRQRLRSFFKNWIKADSFSQNVSSGEVEKIVQDISSLVWTPEALDVLNNEIKPKLTKKTNARQ